MPLRRTSALLLLLGTSALALAQNRSSFDPYLLRLEHSTGYANACVLLQKSGVYHLELGESDGTKVFEGSLKADAVQQVANHLKSFIEALSRSSTEEPLLFHRDLLKLDFVRDGRWSEARFLSAESQEPYRQSLQPLVRWLNDLHKLPHKELSEDAGKNNCLPPGEIALKKRGNQPAIVSSDASKASGTNSVQSNSAAPQPELPLPLLRVDLFGMKSDTYYENCVLIVEDGSYRAEDRSQKSGKKKVETRLNGGRLTPIEVSQLRELLSDSALAKIRHRETSHLELPVSGEMLELKISRPSGLQEIVLSSTFDRPGIPFFYSGDGDIARAQPLLKFLSEHVNNKGLGSLDPRLRNGCNEAP